MRKGDKIVLNSKTQSIVLIAICTVIIALLLGFIIINNNSEKNVLTLEEPQALNEVIEESTELVDTHEIIPRSAPLETVSVDPYEVIAHDIELLKNKDKFIVERYFGNSDVFTADAIADKLSATIVSFLSSEETEDGVKVIVHICTLDYDKMKEASNNIKNEIVSNNDSEENIVVEDEIKKEVAKGVVTGQFDLHYNIPVLVKNNEIIISEEYKQALTGNWYHGVSTELQSVECPLTD